MFPGLALGFSLGGHGEEWRDSDWGFVDHRLTEKEEHFLRTSSTGPPMQPHHRPVSPDRTRSLSLENDLPVSFLIRSTALEDLTAVGHTIRETEEALVSGEFPQQGLPHDGYKSHDKDRLQTLICRPKITSKAGDMPGVSISNYTNGTFLANQSLEYGHGTTVQKQEFDVKQVPKGHKQIEGSDLASYSLEPQKGVEIQCALRSTLSENPEMEEKAVSLGSPSSSSGPPARKSLVPVAQFKGLCYSVLV